MAKDSGPPTTNDLTPVGRGYQETFIFIAGGLGEEVTSLCHKALWDTGAQEVVGLPI